MANKVFRLTELSQIENLIVKLREKLFVLNIPQETFLDIQLAVTEAIGNSFKHGTKGIDKPLVEVEWLINGSSISLKIRDNGSGFNFEDLKVLNEHNLLEEEGRGLFLIFSVLDEVWFNDRGNEICFLKRWGKQEFIPQR